ncbi:MAG: FtsX-like permease family protein [Roseivirga sp.]|nr:FtsX-like permease family protein [Roseivirga sp.]
MFRSTVKIFLRKTSKQLGFFSFQVTGLVTGISVFLMVFSFYQFETSFDSHFSDYQRIYRIERIETRGDNIIRSTSSSRLIPQLAKAEIPEIEKAIGMINGSFDVTRVHYPEDKPWSWLNSHWVSGDFFEVFDFKVLEGNKETLFEDPNAIVITQSMASKIFGEKSPVGKTIFIWNRPRPISGVVEDAPENSHMQFDFLTSMERYFSNPRWDAERIASSWSYLNSVMNYVKLSEGADPVLVEEKINALYSRYKAENDPERSFILLPVNDIHLHSNAHRQITDPGNAMFVQLVFYAGIIIALLTLINFVKISLANVTQRMKETGVRKVLGGSNRSLILSIVSENALIILLAILLSFGLIYSLGSLKISWLPPDIYQDFLTSSLTMIVLLSFLIIGSLIPSAIPVRILSRLSITNALRGTVTSTGHNFGLLRALMSFQVLFSLILITTTLFFKDQVNYILTRDTGFDKDQVLYMELHAENARAESLETFKQYLRTVPGINSVSNSLQVPLKWAGSQSYELREKGTNESTLVSRSGVNHDFFKTLGIEIVEGREFSSDFSDSSSTILNETAVKSLGLVNPIGKKVHHIRGSRIEEKTVVGIVKDFNFRSMHSPLLPAQFIWIPRGPIISVNFTPNSIESILADIEANWGRFSLEGDFNYTFMDDYFASQHDEDIQLKSTISFLSIVIVFLASLGIFGMSAFIGQRKQKEVAIRKVLGSTGSGVFWLLTKNYVITVFIALIVTIYPVYFLVNLWLDNFAYTARINYLNFGLGLVIVLGIVVLVSGINTLKVTIKNPVDTLSHE